MPINQTHDRSKLLIKWNKPSYKQHSHVKIKAGNLDSNPNVTWSTAQTILDNYNLSEEYIWTIPYTGNWKVFIKAVNKIGIESINSSSASSYLKVEPTQPSLYSIQQRTTNRAYIDIVWGAVSDLDLVYYEVCVGDTWNDATKVIVKGGTTYSHYTTTQGVNNFLIRSVNVSAHYSDPIPATINADLIVSAPTLPDVKYSIDTANKSKVTVYWNKLSDPDIASYRVKLDSESWSIAVEVSPTSNSYTRILSGVSGTFRFNVKAVTVAGLESAVTNIDVPVVFEPETPTAFSVSQYDATNLTRLQFSWGGYTDDIDYFEIRKNVSNDWSTATRISTNIKNNFYNYVLSNGETDGVVKYLIKSVNKNGIACVNHAVYTITLALTPAAIPSGIVTAASTNRFNLRIEWENTLNQALDYYEVTHISPLSVSTVIYKGKEYGLSFTATQAGINTFRIRQKNIGGNYFSSYLTLTKIISDEVQAVSNFNCVYSPFNISILNFSWDKSTESDFAYYEIRKGASWEAGNLIATNIKDNVFSYSTVPADVGTAIFWIKSFIASGLESNTPTGKTFEIRLIPVKPLSGGVYQDTNDKSKIVIYWTASTDVDISLYEIRSGSTVIGTTKELSFVYSPSDLNITNYTFNVYAKNLSGYYSTALSLPFIADFNPSDVYITSVSQSIYDHSKIFITWNPPADKDIVSYTVRRGTTWSSYQKEYTGISNTFIEDTIVDENQYTWWIVAVNKGGKMSKNPTSSAISSFDMHPMFPENSSVTVTFEPLITRAKANISWTPINQIDLATYTIVTLKPNGTQVTNTSKNPYFEFPTDISGHYTFTVYGTSVGGYNSTSIIGEADIVVEPASVTNFKSVQNGQTILFVWDKHPELDVVSYEIREGGNFENGSLVVTGVPVTMHTMPISMSITRQFHIKAINSSGKYSLTAVSTVITTTQLLPVNVVFEYDEVSLQTGNKTNAEFGVSVINCSNIGMFTGKYFCSDFTDSLGNPTTRCNELGGNTVLKLGIDSGTGKYYTYGEYLTTIKDMGQKINATISSQFISTNLYVSSTYAILQYRTSEDDVLWSEWKDFVSINATFRYVQFKVKLNSNDTNITPEVSTISIIIDVPDKDRYEFNLTVPVGGINAFFDPESTEVTPIDFYFEKPSFIAVATQTGKYAYVDPSLITKAKGNIKVLSIADNSDVGGTVNWVSKGY